MWLDVIETQSIRHQSKTLTPSLSARGGNALIFNALYTFYINAVAAAIALTSYEDRCIKAEIPFSTPGSYEGGSKVRLLLFLNGNYSRLRESNKTGG